jgi:isoleucyl-tRNA synthetase
VDEQFGNYEPTRAGRAIQEFIIENLSNWFVRLNRKRYWGGDFTRDKKSAYQTLYTCLETVSRLMAPMAPFYAERLFTDLNGVSGRHPEESVHLTDFPVCDERRIDKGLEERMGLAQKISSMVLGLRRKVKIKVRQPLNKLMVPVLDNGFQEKIEAVKDLILAEINVKDIEFLRDTSGILIKQIKPNFKSLGPRYGKLMKTIAAEVQKMTQEDISSFEASGEWKLEAAGEEILLLPDDVDITTEDIPGWLVANDGSLTVALDVTITDELRYEGIAREFINRIQNYRKESGFEVTDKINIMIMKHESLNMAIDLHRENIGIQTLAEHVRLVDDMDTEKARKVELEEGLYTWMKIEKISSDL